METISREKMNQQVKIQNHLEKLKYLVLIFFKIKKRFYYTWKNTLRKEKMSTKKINSLVLR